MSPDHVYVLIEPWGGIRGGGIHADLRSAMDAAYSFMAFRTEYRWELLKDGEAVMCWWSPHKEPSARLRIERWPLLSSTGDAPLYESVV